MTSGRARNVELESTDILFAIDVHKSHSLAFPLGIYERNIFQNSEAGLFVVI